MSLAIALEAEPDFPQQDLSENNAMLLELMLANADIVTAVHTTAEEHSLLFRTSHPALRFASKRLIMETGRNAAFDHGITSFETITALLGSVPGNCDIHAIKNNVVALAIGLNDVELSSYIDEAHEHFITDMPRTADVVLTSSKRFHLVNAAYAVVGAALARQFELDGVE